jgi:hypothetical protein
MKATLFVLVLSSVAQQSAAKAPQEQTPYELYLLAKDGNVAVVKPTADR